MVVRPARSGRAGAVRSAVRFRGGCTLEAAEGVCDAGLDGLQSLVDKSLVRLREGERFWMLESVREFALERLRESGDEDDVQRRHAEFFLQLAESAHLSAETVDLGQRHDLAIPEQDNLRGAIDQALERGDALLGLRITVALEQFWVVQDPNEGRRRLELLLAAAPDAPAPWRARALRDARRGDLYRRRFPARDRAPPAEPRGVSVARGRACSRPHAR